VSPVDDPHAVLDAGRAAQTQVALLALLAQPQVREVGRQRVDLGTGARAPQLLEQRALPVPLLGEREVVLALAARDDLVAQPLELALERSLVVARLLDALFEVPAHALVERDLLGNDAIGHAEPRPDERGARG
jgi:hypothetical protein